ncbi:MAG TPA: gliding motility-associated C-terminal domain-containing protein, partial [Membranihabitans sp.]|nr:gliding motility-associated C-terminal domain-containing protein [Membranihabitans sp.]
SPDRYPFVMESNGCEFTGYIDVLEGTDCDEECPVSLPNAITPNGDGVNDELELFSPCEIQVIEFRVFDKWGGELYRVENESMSAQIWENIAPGVYMVQISYETDRGEMSSVAGGVMVIK